MNFIQRKLKPRPFAANSTGRLRGTLNLGSRIGRVQVYEAIGEARDLFVEISEAIVSHLNDHSDNLQDSASFVDLSLFMMGKSPDRTKPIVMFVSDDKQTRTAAFRMIKHSGIMDDYPGFGLGEMELKAEFENLQPLGSKTDSTSSRALNPQSTSFLAPEELVEVLGTRTGPLSGQRLEVRIRDGPTTDVRRAVGGGVVSFGGLYMLHSVDHFLQTAPTGQDIGVRRRSSSSDTSEVECQVLGLSDDEEDGDEFADVTSRGSATPIISHSRTMSDSSLQPDEQEASVLSYGSFNDQDTDFSDLRSRLEALRVSEQNSFEATTTGERSVRIGHVALRSALLDSAFVRIDVSDPDANGHRIPQLENTVIPLESYQEHIETVPSDTAVRTLTPNGTIGGMLSGTPSFVRLPGSKIFQEVYVAKLNQPLLPGDCGSWIKNAVTGKLLGHVIAGSPTTGLVLVVPAAKVFAEALAAFSAREGKLEDATSLDRATLRSLTIIPDALDEIDFHPSVNHTLGYDRDLPRRPGRSRLPRRPGLPRRHPRVEQPLDLNNLDINERLMEVGIILTDGNIYRCTCFVSPAWDQSYIPAEYTETFGLRIDSVTQERLTPRGRLRAIGSTIFVLDLAAHILVSRFLVLETAQLLQSPITLIIGRDIIEQVWGSNPPPSEQRPIGLPPDDPTTWLPPPTPGFNSVFDFTQDDIGTVDYGTAAFVPAEGFSHSWPGPAGA